MKKILLTMAINNSLLLNSSFLCYDFNANSTNIIKESKEINFLATADIHAGYEDSYSSQTISAIAKKLSKNNNRGVVISGDLVGGIEYTGNLFSYKTMMSSISTHTLAGFGNHDSGPNSKFNQTWLNQNIVKRNAMTAAPILYYASKDEVPVYSWNWSGIHFVQCSLAPINKDVTVEQNNPPGPALTELRKDLETNVGVNNMPVVLSFHYGYDEFSIGENWWNQEQRSEFENTILAKYNVILMSTGHLHFYPNELYTIPVNVGKKTIYDVLSGTALYGGYSEISINPDNKKITIKRHDVNKNDDVVMNFKINY